MINDCLVKKYQWKTYLHPFLYSSSRANNEILGKVETQVHVPLQINNYIQFYIFDVFPSLSYNIILGKP